MNTNIVLTENGACLADGEPQYFVSDSDYAKLLQDVSFANALFEYFGKEKVCIGHVGTEKNGVCVQNTFEVKVQDNSGEERCGFYEKVTT